VLPKLSRYLAPDGIMIISVPNMRNWGIWYNIIHGHFTYGCEGGIMNEEHVRWFTWESLNELVQLSGLLSVSGRLLFPPNIDFKKVEKRLKSPNHVFELPPPEAGIDTPTAEIRFSSAFNLNEQYPYLLANKLVMICKRGPSLVSPVHITEGLLAERRKAETRS
jgi:hypothetical protein